MFKSTTSRSFKLSIFCLLLLLLFTLSLCLAESQKPQQEEEEIIDRETSLTKTPPNGTIQLGASTTSKLAPNEQILADDDDDMEDYDMDDFAILGNEWLLKEIKEVDDQIQSEEDGNAMEGSTAASSSWAATPSSPSSATA